MASAQQSLMGLMSQLQSMEHDFTRILMETALKLATMADASIFLLVESGEGRRYAGKEHLCAAFQQGVLGVLPTDKEMEADISISGLKEKTLSKENDSLSTPSCNERQWTDTGGRNQEGHLLSTPSSCNERQWTDTEGRNQEVHLLSTPSSSSTSTPRKRLIARNSKSSLAGKRRKRNIFTPMQLSNQHQTKQRQQLQQQQRQFDNQHQTEQRQQQLQQQQQQQFDNQPGQKITKLQSSQNSKSARLAPKQEIPLPSTIDAWEEEGDDDEEADDGGERSNSTDDNDFDHNSHQVQLENFEKRSAHHSAHYGDDIADEEISLDSFSNEDVKPENSWLGDQSMPNIELDGQAVVITPVEGKESRPESSSSHLSDFSIAPLPPLAKKRRKRSSDPSEDQFTLTTYPCPGCNERLVARVFRGENQSDLMVDVHTASMGFVPIRRCKDVLIPCAICLVESVGKRPDQWRQAVMKEAHLKTLQHRFRQHMQRKHGLGTRHEQGFAIRELGKRLLCSCLHATEPASGDSAAESTWILPPDRPTIHELELELRDSRLPPPPADWLDWVENSENCGTATIKGYSHYLSKFLGLSKLIFPRRLASILLVWNEAFCQEYFDVLRSTHH